MHRNFKQSYTEAALESWFLKLKKPWEEQFSKAALALGRDFYKQGALRSLILDPKTAKAYTRYEKTEDYVVIEVLKDRWCVRGSYKERLHNEALGIATLYEIEELLAQGLHCLPTDTTKSPLLKAGPSLGSSELDLPFRPLCGEFQLQPQGLFFYPFWKIEGDKRLSTFDRGPLSKKERALLIQLALQAKKSGFKADTIAKAYFLKDLEAVPPFLKHTFPTWRFVHCALGPTLTDLKIYTLEAQLKARHWDDFLFILELSLYFYKQGQLQDLNQAQKKQVLQARKTQNAIFFEGYGILNIRLENHSSLESFLEQSPTGESLYLPKYQLLSFHPKVEAQLDASLIAWKKEAASPYKQDKLAKDLACFETRLPLFLRPYQKEGVLWLRRLCGLGLHPLLADDMGLGKTLQVLSFLCTFANRAKPSAIICPSSVLSVWRKEIQTFFKDQVVEDIRPLENLENTNNSSLTIVLLSYGQLRQNQEKLKTFSFEYLVLDEAQYIKNAASKTAKAACSLQAQYRIALSGTPIENHLDDIASIFGYLMPGLLGKRKDFQAFYLKNGEGASLLLKEQLQPFILRRLKEEAAPDLPSKTEIILSCPFTPLQKKLYLKYCELSLQQLRNDLPALASSSALSLLTALLRLRQVCCAPFLLPQYRKSGDTSLEYSSKLIALLNVLPNLLERGHKVVIFSQFTSLLEPLKDQLKSLFPTCPLYYLSGKTQDRALQVEGFQQSQGAALFLLSLKAGGTGLTLHAADYAFLLDPWWNPAVEEQAVNRIHRLGQTKPVFIYRLITPGTVEERIQDLKQFKHGLAEGVLGSEHILQALASTYSSLKELIEYREI